MTDPAPTLGDKLRDPLTLRPILRRGMLVVAALLLFYLWFRFETFEVPDGFNACVPEINPGDRLIIDRWFPAASLRQAENPPYVLFSYPKPDGTTGTGLSRVAGRPGDRIEARPSEKDDDWIVFIEGVAVVRSETEPGLPEVLGEHEFLLVNPLRGTPFPDSIRLGAIHEDFILGMQLFTLSGN
jgi:hypothetical protein